MFKFNHVFSILIILHSTYGNIVQVNGKILWNQTLVNLNEE
jgi:hypothetical protein